MVHCVVMLLIEKPAFTALTPSTWIQNEHLSCDKLQKQSLVGEHLGAGLTSVVMSISLLKQRP